MGIKKEKIIIRNEYKKDDGKTKSITEVISYYISRKIIQKQLVWSSEQMVY